MISLRLLNLALAVAAVGCAQSPDAEWGRMVESRQAVTEYMNRRARAITDRAGAEISNRQAWEKVRDQRREELRDMVGLLPWPARTPLNVRITGKIDRGDFLIEKIQFESLPKF